MIRFVDKTGLLSPASGADCEPCCAPSQPAYRPASGARLSIPAAVGHSAADWSHPKNGQRRLKLASGGGSGARRCHRDCRSYADSCDLIAGFAHDLEAETVEREDLARLRDRRSVLVQVGWPRGRWPDEPELTLAVRRVDWEGIGWGWGHCRARRVEACLTGRRGAGRDPASPSHDRQSRLVRPA